MKRYKVVNGSESGHCCFLATVVDTKHPAMITGEHHEEYFKAVCECFDTEDAKRICKALNAEEQSA